MTCDTIKDLMVASIIDGLDDEASQRLQQHVAECPDCAAELEALGELWAQVGFAAQPEPEAGARNRLAAALARFRSEEGSSSSTPTISGSKVATAGRRSLPRQLTALAASVLLIAGGAALGATLARSSQTTAEAGDGRPTFLVLMRGESGTPAAPEPTLASWLAGLREDERLIGGAQVSSTDGAWFGPTPEPFNMEGVFELFGYMVIQARDAEEAREIASTSPHIGSQGAVEIWSIR